MDQVFSTSTISEEHTMLSNIQTSRPVRELKMRSSVNSLIPLKITGMMLKETQTPEMEASTRLNGANTTTMSP